MHISELAIGRSTEGYSFLFVTSAMHLVHHLAERAADSLWRQLLRPLEP
jgi:hypothetical protein